MAGRLPFQFSCARRSPEPPAVPPKSLSAERRPDLPQLLWNRISWRQRRKCHLHWKRRYAGLGLSELRELRQLREENRKLKTLVADLTLDKHILQEVLSKKA